MSKQELYKVVRFQYPNPFAPVRTVKRGLTLEQAQEWCSREDTRGGSVDDGTAWFDGYERQ